MRKHDYFILLLIIVASVFIYLKRTSTEQQFDQAIHFEKDVALELGELKENALTLVAIFDPVSDCPGCLEEAFVWVEPLATCPFYDVLFLVPEDLSIDDLKQFAQSLHIGEDKFIRFSKGSAAAKIHSTGVFKAIYSQEKGVLWEDRGNYSPIDQAAFREKLYKTVRSAGCS